MAIITLNNAQYEVNPDESVLDGLLRHDVQLNYSCKNGVCQSCMLRAIDTDIPETSQKGLKSTLRDQGYFLACQCFPEENITISEANDSQLYWSATVVDKLMLSTDVCRLRLDCSMPVFYHSGQFINLHRQDGESRSYSLASLPQDKYIELHIKRMDDGVMSSWIHDELKPGDMLDLQGPFGDCFYIQDDVQKPMLLIGTGTGIAPLWGIAKDALNSGHKEPIKLYFGSRKKQGLYLDKELRILSAEYENFEYIPCISGDEDLPDCQKGRANDLALQHISDLKNWNIYLSGLPAMVNTTRKLAYLSGVPMSQIYIDPFEMKDLRSGEC